MIAIGLDIGWLADLLKSDNIEGFPYSITLKDLLEILKNGASNVLRVLLDCQGQNIRLSNQCLMRIVRETRDEAILSLLFGRCHEKVKITTKIIQVAARYRTKVIMDLLLNNSGGFKITEAILQAAAINRNGESVMRLFLDRYGDDFRIIESIVQAAAANCHHGEKIMRLLLGRRGEELTISENVVQAAAANDNSGEKIIQLLLDQRGEEFRISESIVEAGAAIGYAGKNGLAIVVRSTRS